MVGDYDLVVPVITDGRLERDKMARLVAAIRAGTGLAGYHMGLATSFRDSVPFRYAASCYWVAHPRQIIPYRVEITRPDHPIMAGLESFEHVSEQYYLNYDPAVEVLATTTFSGASSLAQGRRDAGGVHHHAWSRPGVLLLARAHGRRAGNPACAHDPATRLALGSARARTEIALIQAAVAGLDGSDQDEHVFALTQSLELYDTYQVKMLDCDRELTSLKASLTDKGPSRSLYTACLASIWPRSMGW